MVHVLIIEDEPLIALDLEALLESEGAASFAFAASEGDAVAAANDHRPDIITSDVTLLQGTGPAAVSRIRAALGPIPVIYISATEPDDPGADLLTRILRKPVDRAALVTVFREIRNYV